MFELEPGPFELLDPASLRPLAPRPSFTGIVADALDNVPGIRASLDNASLGVTDNPPTDLDSTYGGTIGVAKDIVANDINTAPASPVPQLVDTGDQAAAIRSSVLQFLPQPDLPIDATFVEPPQPPGNPVSAEPPASPGAVGGDAGRT